MKYILDTCIVSHFFRKTPSVIEKMQAQEPRNICISSITQFEIEFGLGLNKEREKTLTPIWRSFLEKVAVLPFDSDCAKESAKIRSRLAKIGTPIEPYDTLIAGACLANKAICVTDNIKEFSRVESLSFENWAKAHK